MLATNIYSITSYSKIREEIKSMCVCMYCLCEIIIQNWVLLILAGVSKSVNHRAERSPTGKFAEVEEGFRKTAF